MQEKTRKNIYDAFVGEAKAYFRLLAYADKADEEDLPQVALLFRAIAEAERVHATRQLNLVKDLIVKDTDTNLEASFQREKTGALNWCSRQISATVLTPVSSSITRRALNSGLNVRRLAIVFPLSWTDCT